MKAVVIDEVGAPDVLQVRDIPRPVPASDQVLIEVHASSVNPIDGKIRDGSMSFRFGKEFPKVLGFDVAGVVVETGSDATNFQVGDPVFARSELKTGCACAEYIACAESSAALKPRSISYQQAAAIPLAGLTALQGLRDDCQLGAGDRVLIIGASGGVGTYAVQIARAMGAEVTAVCSGVNLDLVKSLGASRVIDYTSEPVFGTAKPYDAIYDVVGSQRFRAGRKALKPDGNYAAAVPSPGVILGMFLGNKFRRQQARFVMCKPSGEDLKLLAEWVTAGRLRSVIDSVFALEDIVLAHERIATKRSRGKIVIEIR